MCNGYNGKKKDKHEWFLIAGSYTTDREELPVDIVCANCGMMKMVLHKNNEKTEKTIEKIKKNYGEFIIPRDIFLYSE